MTIALIPGTEHPKTVLAGLGTTLVGLSDAKTIDLDLFGTGWGLHAKCDLHGDIREAALREIDAYCRILTGAPKGQNVVQTPDHPVNYDRWYGHHGDAGQHVSLDLRLTLGGSIAVTGLAPKDPANTETEHSNTQSLQPTSISHDMLFVQLDGLLDKSPMRATGVADLAIAGNSRQQLARQLLEMDALVLYLGSERPVSGKHATELRRVLSEMSAQAALAQSTEPAEALSLNRIVLAIGNVGAGLQAKSPSTCLFDATPEALFEDGMRAKLIEHRDILTEIAHLSKNLNVPVAGSNTHPFVICVPTDLLGDVHKPARLNRDPLMPDQPLLRSRDFARSRATSVDTQFQAMIDALRARWCPFNFATPLICAASDVLSPLAMVLDQSDWKAVEAGPEQVRAVSDLAG